MRVSGSTRPVPMADTASPAISSLVPCGRRGPVMVASLTASGRAGRPLYRQARFRHRQSRLAQYASRRPLQPDRRRERLARDRAAISLLTPCAVSAAGDFMIPDDCRRPEIGADEGRDHRVGQMPRIDEHGAGEVPYFRPQRDQHGLAVPPSADLVTGEPPGERAAEPARVPAVGAPRAQPAPELVIAGKHGPGHQPLGDLARGIDHERGVRCSPYAMHPSLGVPSVPDAGRTEPRASGERGDGVARLVPGRAHGRRPGGPVRRVAAAVVPLPDPHLVHQRLVVVADEPGEVGVDLGQRAALRRRQHEQTIRQHPARNPPSGETRTMKHRGDRTLVTTGLARVEGEGSMYVRVAGGLVEEVRLDIYEPPRFFEAFLRGRSYTEPPDLTARICGICPIAYQTSACQAIESACGATLPGGLAGLRRLLNCGEWISSHA